MAEAAPAPVQTRPAPTPAVDPPIAEEGALPADGAGNAALASLFGRQADGSFAIDIGTAPGLRLRADETAGTARIDLADRARPIPGLLLESATYNHRNKARRVQIAGRFAIPHVRDAPFNFYVADDGRPSFDIHAHTDLPALKDPEVRISLDEEKRLTASVAIAAADLTPRGMGRNLTVTGGGTLTLADGKLSGRVQADLAYLKLGSGSVDLSFTGAGRLNGSGRLALTAGFLAGAAADLAVDDAGALTAAADIPAARLVPAIPGLTVTGGVVHLTYANGVTGGSLEQLALTYAGFGGAIVSARITERGQIEGNGEFAVAIAGFAEAKGDWRFRNGALAGSVTITGKQFPAALPVSSGQITATLAESGAVSFAGQVGVTLGPAGDGQLRASYDSASGKVQIGATINLTVPGLQGATFTVTYIDGLLEGSGDVPIDPGLLPGVTGAVHVQFREGRWAGETELAYSADDGKLSGSIRVAVAQTEAGALQVSGGGDVTAQIAPRLQGTLHAEILPEGGVDVSGSIRVTEPLELFPEWRDDKTLVSIQRNIPLWAMLVAVFRLRAGVRAGIGPGVFRNIVVEGSYTIGQEGEPSFSISGEMFIPAFVEGYLSIGAGLGLDVVLGELTGGIEAVATAGIYGAVSVIPELSYEGGDYKIEGTATLAAGARLKLGLNAWAKIEALWITVWDKTWNLGEWMWNIGPDLGLQAHLAYNFSNPAPPTIEFKSSDIDTEALIAAAIPEDGPAPSGARGALQNNAEWKGQLREQRAAAAVPPELAQQAGAAEPAPGAPARPPARPAPPAGAAPPPATDPATGGGVAAPGAEPRPAADRDRAAAAVGPAPARAPTPGQAGGAAVADAAKPPAIAEQPLAPGQAPPTDQPRYPRAVSLSTLDEPPVPVPRTPEQQQEDVNAASAVVSMIEDKVEDTDALEAFFPRLKRRFQLSTIGLVPDGHGGACVKVEINPIAYNPVDELLRGADVERPDGLALRTEVQFFTDRLAGRYPVGTKMVARLLGPDHPAGGPPSGQEDLMGRLPNAGTEVGNYIRGHLLNDNIGGPGEPKNLFPITQSANRLHEQFMERTVKRWVNQDRYWVFYSVAIVNEQYNLTDTSKPYFVSATIDTEAAVLKVNRRKSTTLAERAVAVRSEATIADNATDVALRPGDANTAWVGVVSRANTAAGAQADAGMSAEVAGHAALPFDKAATINESTRSSGGGPVAIDPALLDAVAALRDRGGFRWTKVLAAIEAVAGLGAETADLLVECIQRPALLASLEPSRKGLITRANNERAAIVRELSKI